jgi:dienelactone hydrolase
MLQRVSFPVAGGEIEGIVHLPDGDAVGGAAVLHGFGGHPEQTHIVASCEALAAAGVGALRFAYRDHEPPRMTLDSALADTAAALRLLKAHPRLSGALGIVGFSFGGTVAAITAGRDSRVKAAVLAAAPAHFARTEADGRWKPVAELSRTRARVLLVWGSRDTQVPYADAERYAAVLTQARVRNRIVTIEGADHDFNGEAERALMLVAVTDWMRDSLG